MLTGHMFTIIGADGKEYGPVSLDQLNAWIAAGRANLQTKAKRDGENDWKTLGEFAEFNAPPVVTAGQPPEVRPTSVPPAATAGRPTQGTAVEIAAALADRAANFDFLSCISRSFELWKAHLLPLTGVTFLSLFIQWVVQIIPILGIIGGLLLNGVFIGGLYYYYLGKIRGEPRTVGDIFAGFSKAPVPLMLTNLLITALILLVMLPFFGPLFFAVIGIAMHGASAPATMPVLGGVAIFGLILGIIPLMYLAVSWVFAFVLVIDQGLGPWTALEVSRRVVSRRWFSMFGLMICAGIVAMLGLIGLFIGIFFTLPLMFGSMLYAYEDLCTHR